MVLVLTAAWIPLEWMLKLKWSEWVLCAGVANAPLKSWNSDYSCFSCSANANSFQTCVSSHTVLKGATLSFNCLNLHGKYLDFLEFWLLVLVPAVDMHGGKQSWYLTCMRSSREPSAGRGWCSNFLKNTNNPIILKGNGVRSGGGTWGEVNHPLALVQLWCISF